MGKNYDEMSKEEQDKFDRPFSFGNIFNAVGNAYKNITNWWRDWKIKAGTDERTNALEDQRSLMEAQLGYNKQAAEHSQELQKQMVDYTSPEMQVQRFKDAGLNPAMVYGMGGGGGTTTGSAATAGVGNGNTDVGNRRMAKLQGLGMAMQMAKMRSEIKVNESVAEANKATAIKNVQEARTTNDSRAGIVEKLKQEGVDKYLQNLKNQWLITGHDNSETGRVNFQQGGWGYSQTVGKNAFVRQEAVAMILKAEAEAGNSQAQSILNNKKAEGYATELANAIMHAESDEVRAAAAKLEAEFRTGDTINWKNMGEAIVKILMMLK